MPGAQIISSLPSDNILNWTKFKAFADEKLKVAKMTNLILDRLENIVGKEGNAGFQHFLLFQKMFSKGFSSRL